MLLAYFNKLFLIKTRSTVRIAENNNNNILNSIFITNMQAH